MWEASLSVLEWWMKLKVIGCIKFLKRKSRCAGFYGDENERVEGKRVWRWKGE